MKLLNLSARARRELPPELRKEYDQLRECMALVRKMRKLAGHQQRVRQ
jgi:hypothetical protein